MLKDRVTIYEVAKVANVSLATVSRVINNRGNVKEKTRKKVEETIAKLNFQPSSLAQGLATSKTTNIAVLLPSVNYVYVSNILNGAIDVGRIYGYRTTVFASDNQIDKDELVTNIITSHCDGLILLGQQLDSENLKRLNSYNIKTVIIGNQSNSQDAGLVEIDYSSKIKELVRTYLDQGIKDIALLRYKMSHMYFLNNVNEAVESVYREYGLEFDNYINIDDSYHGTYDYFLSEFKNNAPVHQVYIAPRDSLANAIVNAASDCGINVPDAFDVIGIIGTKYSIVSRPTLSSMSVDMYEVGSVAARMLTKMLAGQEEEQVFKLNCDYIQRASTKWGK